MALILGVDFFVSFYQLDPAGSVKAQCIFFTQKGLRCKNYCYKDDTIRASELQKIMNATSRELVSLDLLREYASCNCCQRARHGHRIVDIGLLLPLAQRWLDEIKTHSNRKTPATLPKQSSVARYACAIPGTRVSGGTTVHYLPSADPSNSPSDGHKLSRIDAKPYTPVVSSSHHQRGSLGSASTIDSGSKTFKDLSQNSLSLSDANSYVSTASQPISTTQPPQSEFRPHVERPSPDDSVLQKLLNPLQKRDFETGSLYMFDRSASPGHVKIGWTARSVQGRLDNWSKCGYTPNLLFSIDDVPYANRVETLIHHELIKEWRRERMCKAPHCRKSHQEWFEISKERAQQVMRDWADFVTMAEPYDRKGALKPRWTEILKAQKGKGKIVNANMLMAHFRYQLFRKAALIGEPVGGNTPIIKEENFENSPQEERREILKGKAARVKSSPTPEPASSRNIYLLENGTSLGNSEARPIKPERNSLGRSFSVKPPAPTTRLLTEVLPQQIQSAPSPALDTTTIHQDALASQEKKHIPSTRSSAIKLVSSKSQVAA